MSTIPLTPALIEKAKEMFPKNQFTDGPPIAKHKLFNKFKEAYPNYPKLIFYIVMDDLFGQARELDGNDLAYAVDFNPLTVTGS